MTPMRRLPCALLFLAMAAHAAEGHAVATYTIVGNGIPASLTATPGDMQRGATIVLDRQTGLCVLCHQAPASTEKIHSNIAGNLAGAGSRWTQAQLRLRVVDSRQLDPASIMPAYHRVEGLQRVSATWAARPILDAQQIEDVVAYLVSLK